MPAHALRPLTIALMTLSLLGGSFLATGCSKPASQDDEAAALRIAPVGKTAFADDVSASADAATDTDAATDAAAESAAPATQTASNARTGEQLYKQTCSACHATGAAGAPIVGKNDSWAPHIAKGLDTLMHSAINGINAMPPRGTAGSATDFELQRAVVYMANKSGANFDEPKE